MEKERGKIKLRRRPTGQEQQGPEGITLRAFGLR